MKKKFLKLNNGMELLIERISGVNVVSIYLVIKSGSKDDLSGKEGCAHFLEHMIFKSDNISDRIEALGGSINAYTSLDETAFYINILKQNWLTGLKILKNMVFNARFNKNDFLQEKKVILEELSGGHDNPYKVLIDETFKISFKGHNYSKPIIGYEESLKNLELDDVEEFYKNNYLSDNSLLVVVGDISIEKSLDSLKNIFSTIKKRKNRAKNSSLPILSNEKISILNKDVNQNYLNITFRFPGGYFKDFATVHIISSLLGDFKTSPLEEKLKENLQLVTDINTFFYVCREHSLFIINSVFPIEVNPNDVLKEIFKELELFKTQKISFEQIYKARINHKADLVYNKEGVAGEARNLVFYHITTGNFKNEEKFLKDVEKISEKEIKKVLKRYFKEPFITLVTSESSSKINIDEISIIKVNKRRFRQGKKELIELKNGIKVVFEKNSRLPIISFDVAFLGGVKFETEKDNGACYLMSKLLLKGSKNFSKREISERFDFFSGLINSFSGRNSFGIEAVILKEYFNEALKIVFDSVKDPLFLDNEFEKEKKTLIDRITAEQDEPFTIVLKEFFKNIFSGTPYSKPVRGTVESIKSLSLTSVKNLHKQLVKSKNMVIGITGDFNSENIEYLKELFETFPEDDFHFNIEQIPIENKGALHRVFSTKKQCHIIAGFRAPSLFSDDSIPLKVLEGVLGNHSGKLFLKLREELGLCYSTTAFFMDALECGTFAFYIATSPENENIAIEKIRDILKELKKGNITNEEIKRAKNHIIGSKERLKQKFINISIKNSYNILYNLGMDYDKKYMKLLNKVSKKDILNVMEKYFIDENFLITVLSSKEK